MMRDILRRIVKRSRLRSIVKLVDRRAIKVTELRNPLEAIYTRSDIVFEVPIGMCCNPSGFSYDPDGWHPFVRTILQYMDNRETTYEDSILHRYYRTFQPETFWDVFFPEDRGDKVPNSSRYAKCLLKEKLLTLPWEPAMRNIRGEANLSASHGNQFFGPVSAVKGEWEFSRLTGICESILRKGYRPTRHRDGEIRGYFLKMGEEYRFMIRAGFHRAAVLSALDHSMIRVKFKSKYPRINDIADRGNWALLNRGLIDKCLAERISKVFFTDNGRGKAERLGLTDRNWGTEDVDTDCYGFTIFGRPQATYRI